VARSVVHGERRYAVDTSLYIDALRTEAGSAALNAFHVAYAPFEYLSAVVVHELRAGVRGRAADMLEDAIIAPFQRRGRLLTPSYTAWKESGRVLSTIISPSGWDSVSRSFVNDALLAMSCREAGVVLVTRNVRDFTRIAGVRSFDFVTPWPMPQT
jgi:predicted nucleic acid-binding protein